MHVAHHLCARLASRSLAVLVSKFRGRWPGAPLWGVAALALLATEARPAALPVELVPNPDFAPSFEKAQGVVRTMATYSTGHVLVAGQFSSVGESLPTSIARFSPDGALDATFASAEFSGGTIDALLILSDSRILVGGRFTSVAGEDRPGLARLNADGSHDLTFLPELTGEHQIAQLGLQSSGRIVVRDTAPGAGGVYRLFQDGRRDASFGPTGAEFLNAVFVLQPDDRIVYSLAGDRPQRLTADGQPDPSYRIAEAIYGQVTTVGIQPDGKVLVGGLLTEVASGELRLLLRLNADGTLDTTFVQQGFVGFPAHLLTVGPEGAIYVAGYDLRDPYPYPSRVHRFSSTGVEDAAFNAYAAPHRLLKAMAVLRDGMLLVAGDPTVGMRAEESEIARVLPDGSEAPGPVLTVRTAGTVRAVVQLQDGNWLVGGDFSRTNGEATGSLAKLDAAGRLVDGFVSGTGIDGIVHALAEAPDGRILVGGAFSHYGSLAAPNIIQLTATGAAHPTFQPGTGPDGPVHTILAHADGRATLGGAFTHYNGSSAGGIVRVDATGARDAAFQAAPGFSGDVNTLVALPEGRMLVGGAFYQHAGTDAGGVLRLLADGTRDPTFTLSSGHTYRPTLALSTSSDGTRIIGCSTSVFWLNADGSHLVLQSPDGQARGISRSFVAQPDGSFLAAGSLNSTATNVVRHPVARILADGSLDESFAVAGVVSAGESRTLHDLGRYRLLVGGGWTRFQAFAGRGLVMLQPGPKPAILAQPESVRSELGATVTFSIDAVGQNLQYQWYHDNVAVAGATSARLILNGIDGTAAGTYHVLVSNSLGSVRSREVTLTGSGPAPVVTSTPQTIAVRSGDSATFSVAVSGTQAFRFVWRHQGIVVANSDSRDLVIAPATFASAGLYEVEVFDGLNSVRAPMGRLTVLPEAFSPSFRPSSRWDISPEVAGGTVNVLTAGKNGEVVLGGNFGRVGTHRSGNLARLMADGSVDTRFRAAAIPGGDIQSIAVQDDGRILIGGSFTMAGGMRQRGITRFLADGSVDTTFNTVNGDLPDGSPARIYAIGLQSDGRIIVAGDFNSFNGSTNSGIVRLHPDGTLDNTFGGLTGFAGIPTALLVLPDDRLVVGGSFTGYQGVAAVNLVRLTRDGTLDPAFSPATGLDGHVLAIAVQDNGALLIGGGFSQAKGLTRHGLARLTPEGALDASFDPPFAYATVISSIGATSTGRIMVGGRIYRPSSPTASLLRLNNAGTVDGTFAVVPAATVVELIVQLPSGRILTAGTRSADVNGAPSPLALFEADGAPIPAYAPAFLNRSTVSYATRASGGGFYASGYFTHINGVPRRYLARFAADGTLDDAFTPPDSIGPGATLLAQPDGSLYTTVIVPVSNGTQRGRVARLLGNGAIDPSFSAPIDTYGPLAVQADGRVVVSGRLADGPPGQPGTGILRLNTDGSIDPTMATGTGVTTPYAGITELISGVDLQADGRIVVAGNFSAVNGTTRRGVVRLSPGGAIDTSFDANETFAEVLRIAVHDIALLANGNMAVGTGSGMLILDGAGALAQGYAPENYNWDRVLALAPADPETFVLGGETPLAGITPRLLEAMALSGARTSLFDASYVLTDGTQARVDSLFFLDDGHLVAAGADIPDATGSPAGLVVFEPDPYAGAISGPSVVVAGQPATLRARIDDPALTYQWYFGGTAIPGATGAALILPSAQGLHRGDYHVVVTNARGLSRSSAFTLAIENGPDSDSRLLNLSTRALSLDGESILVPGFVIQGGGTKRLLLRAVGPRLADFGVPGVLIDPYLVVKKKVDEVYEDIANNNNWGDAPNAEEIRLVASQVGAFNLLDGSLDSALLLDLPAGQYTAFGRDAQMRPGVAMVEVYDADGDTTSARLINMSNRGHVGAGGDVMIPGFVVSSEGPRTFLIRAVGPTLRNYSVTGTLDDPYLTVFRRVPGTTRDEVLFSNDDWSVSVDAARTASVATLVGAFPLDAASKDAALVVTLPPGVYTVHAAGVAGATGVALVEIYLVP